MDRSQEAFREVFAAHGRAIYAYCLRRTSPDDALDAAADVFLTAWRRVRDMPEGDATLPWLYGVARRVLSQQRRTGRRWRRLQRRAGAMHEPGADGPEAIVLLREETRLVLDALHLLRPADREVLRLATWDELDHATIAGLLGCSVNAVDQRLHRARRRLVRQYRSLERSPIRRTARTVLPDQGGPR